MKKGVSILIITCMLFTNLAFLSEAEASTDVCKQNGFYKFYSEEYGPAVSISKKYITFKDDGLTCVRYGKKKFKDFKYDGTDNLMDGDYKFKLAKKIYIWDSEYPAHKVRKFGTKLYVSNSKTITRSKLYKKRKNYQQFVMAYVIVKKGKVVGIGDAAY